MIRGRGIVDEDEKESRQVAVVNEAANKAPVELNNQKYEIVGVVKNVRSALLFDVARPRAYVPLAAAGFASPGLKGAALCWCARNQESPRRRWPARWSGARTQADSL